MTSPQTLILYHGNCPDGFGGAYAAWKKFGDAAEYIPLHRSEPLPEVGEGSAVYLIDYTPNSHEDIQAISSRASSLTILDHHEGIAELTTLAPEHVYDPSRSGATIAWNYFHPETPVPYFLKLLEDQDNFKLELADTVPVHAYIETHPYTFEDWDQLVQTLENLETREDFLVKARAYAEYFELLADMAINKAKLVSFEGREVPFATSHPFKSLKSHVGARLARSQGPIALVVSAHPKGYGVSIRGDGSVDVAAIAQKYGGNGHTSSAGFAISREGPFPWELIEDDEDTGN